ncbi:MAG: sulfatase [Phycisphaerae bacterium]
MLAAIVIVGSALLVWNLAGRKPRNVFVILIDTLRQDALGCYGNPGRTTPAIDGIAADGVRFDRTISTSGWTLPAVASLLTGTWPRIHGGMGKNTALTVIRDEVPTAAEILKQAGYTTLAFANAAFVSPMLHLDRGFDLFDHRYAYNWDIRRADETVDTALKALAEHRNESNFVLIHIFDPHLDYDPPAEYATRHTRGRADPPLPLDLDTCLALRTNDGRDPPLPQDIDYIRGAYLGEVEFVDAQVGRFVDNLKAMNLYDQATLIITADHGEEFWDHGGFEHGHTLYDELVHVPLIVKLPAKITPARRVVPSLVSIIDIMPTVFDLLDVEPPPTFIGESLLPAVMGKDTKDRRCFSESILYGGEKFAWYSGRYKYIHTLIPSPENRDSGSAAVGSPTAELYDWQDDPRERNNLIEAHPEIAARMREELRVFSNELTQQTRGMSSPRVADMSPQHIQSLRSLGYIR